MNDDNKVLGRPLTFGDVEQIEAIKRVDAMKKAKSIVVKSFREAASTIEEYCDEFGADEWLVGKAQAFISGLREYLMLDLLDEDEKGSEPLDASILAGIASAIRR